MESFDLFWRNGNEGKSKSMMKWRQLFQQQSSLYSTKQTRNGRHLKNGWNGLLLALIKVESWWASSKSKKTSKPTIQRKNFNSWIWVVVAGLFCWLLWVIGRRPISAARLHSRKLPFLPLRFPWLSLICPAAQTASH